MISLNGRDCDMCAGDTVAGAIGLLGLSCDSRGIAVALDGEVIPRARWETTRLGEGAQVEVLTAMQGG